MMLRRLFQPLSLLLLAMPPILLFFDVYLLNLTSSFALSFDSSRLARRLTDARQWEPRLLCLRSFCALAA